MRCLTLADTLTEEGWQCHFATNAEAAGVVPALSRSGHRQTVMTGPPEDEAAEIRNLRPKGVGLLVIDHYHRDEALERPLRDWAERILVIDDLADRCHDCDWLLDQTFRRDPAHYRNFIPPSARPLTGSAYALVRPLFQELREQALAHRHARGGRVERLLVMAGIADPSNLIGTALEAIARAEVSVAVDVVVGSAAPNLASNRALGRSLGLEVVFHYDCEDVASLMAGADLAVSAGGSTTWECCTLGLPMVLIQVADNQRMIVEGLAEHGAARAMGDREDTGAGELAAVLGELFEDHGRVLEMGRRAAAVCDGRGRRRVLLWTDPEPVRNGRPLTLRPITRDDASVVLAWQRYSETRRHFRDPNPPTDEEHARWVERAVEANSKLIEIIECDGAAAGLLQLSRIEQDGTRPHGFEVSILVAPEFRRRGIARAALRAARRLIVEAPLVAYVKKENQASRALFRGLGYIPAGSDWFRLAPASVGNRV